MEKKQVGFNETWNVGLFSQLLKLKKIKKEFNLPHPDSKT